MYLTQNTIVIFLAALTIDICIVPATLPAMDDAAALAVVNGRLKKGEGWIGYRYSKNAHGERVQSKSLYFSFYQNGKQKFILTRTNDPEQAYRDLLEARG